MGIVPTQSPRREDRKPEPTREASGSQRAGEGGVPRRFRPGTPQRLDPGMLPPEVREIPVGPNVENV